MTLGGGTPRKFDSSFQCRMGIPDTKVFKKQNYELNNFTCDEKGVDGANVEGVKEVSAWDLLPQVDVECSGDRRIGISECAGNLSFHAASSCRYRAAQALGSGALRGPGDG